MGGEWGEVTLSDIASITSGKRPGVVFQTASSEFQIPVIGGGGPSGFTNRALFDDAILITGRVGTLGKLFATNGPTWPSDNALVIQCKTKNTLLAYLRYALQVVIADAAGMNRGAANPLITQGDLGTLPIFLPPLSEQRAIAHILGTLDDKIELNRKMNATLEEMARALFKSWFVDFDPVRAKATGRAPNLPKAIADLFPSAFQDSELGEIPKGWKVGTIGEITEIVTKGTTPTNDDIAGAEDNGGTVNYLRVNAINDDGTIDWSKLLKMPRSVHDGILKRSILRQGDVVYTIAGTIGRTAVVEADMLPANCNQAVAILRPKSTIPSDFIIMTMINSSFRDLLHANVVHAVQANLSLGMISNARVVLPEAGTLNILFDLIRSLKEHIRCRQGESRTLASLRDALLPKLISGEVRVGDAERIIGRVG